MRWCNPINTKTFLATRVISARGPVSASAKWGRAALPLPVLLHRKGLVREHSGGGLGTVGLGLQRHIQSGYLWGWGRTALAPRPQNQCPGWPRAVPGSAPRLPGTFAAAAASSRAPPCGLGSPTWSSTRTTSGDSFQPIHFRHRGPAPPLKGAGRLVCELTPPCTAAALLGLWRAEPVERANSRALPPRLRKAKAWQGPGPGSGGGGSP